MSRRKLLIGFAAASLPSLGAAAAPPTSLSRVGVLGLRDYDGSDWWSTFISELRAHGRIEGKNFVFIRRNCGDHLQLLDGMAAELTALQVDVVLCTSREAVAASQKATKSIPIVIAASGDPVKEGWVASLAHPGGNITGSSVLDPEMEVKQLEILMEVLGAPKVVAYVVFQPFRFRPAVVEQVARMEAAARARGGSLQTRAIEARGLDEAFGKMARDGVNGVVLQNFAAIGLEAEEVGAIVLKHRIPTIMTVRDYAEAGVPFTYGVKLADIFRKAAIYVARILEGAKPADLPVQLPTQVEFVINLKAASALGLRVPASVLLRADEVLR